MNGKTSTANPLLVALFLLAPGASRAAADTPADWVAEAAEKQEPRCRPRPALGPPRAPRGPAGGWFNPHPTQYDGPYVPQARSTLYDKKHLNPRRTALELGRRLYDRGAYKPRPTWLGAKNPIGFHFMSYGDLRVAGAYYDNGTAGGNGKTEQSVIAARLNLDMDAAFTATERIHAFVRPLDKNGSFTRYQISGGANDDEFVDEFDFQLDTLFFEGDLGAMSQGWTKRVNQLDLPVAIGACRVHPERHRFRPLEASQSASRRRTSRARAATTTSPSSRVQRGVDGRRRQQRRTGQGLRRPPPSPTRKRELRGRLRQYDAATAN